MARGARSISRSCNAKKRFDGSCSEEYQLRHRGGAQAKQGRCKSAQKKKKKKKKKKAKGIQKTVQTNKQTIALITLINSSNNNNNDLIKK